MKQATMHLQPALEHVRSVSLPHDGECGLLGVGPDLAFYAEEIYGDDGWMAQSAFAFDGRSLHSVDEAFGDNLGVERLPKPADLVRPRPVVSAGHLNFGGARHRGLVTEDRVEEVVRPLDMADRMHLAEHASLPVLPPAILGVAQSYVASEVQLVAPGPESPPLFLLSRRLRIAYRLPQPVADASGEVVDYDSHEVAVLQRFTPGADGESLAETLLSPHELGTVLNWPTDIVLRDGALFVADSARQTEGLTNKVHIWQVTLMNRATES